MLQYLKFMTIRPNREVEAGGKLRELNNNRAQIEASQ